MKLILSTIILSIFCFSTVCAQMPQYYWANDTSSFSGGYGWTVGGAKAQIIYYPANFPSAPSGHIVNLYLKTGSRSLASQSIYYNFKVKMGYTTADSFTNAPINPDTFKAGLITVFDSATFEIPGTDTIGKWIKIPLNKSSFYYRGKGTPESRNIVVEFSFGPKNPNSGFLVRNSVIGHKRYLGGSQNDVATKGVSNKLLDFGFDFGAPIGVTELNNITSLDLFPNPACDGKFNIAFDASKTVRQVHVAVTDIAGKQVFDGQYTNASTSFFRAIDAGNLPKGIYFIRVEADGEVLNRRLVMQ